MIKLCNEEDGERREKTSFSQESETAVEFQSSNIFPRQV